MPQQKPLALVLGGTAPHIELLKNLQGRGYHTLLIDYYENPIAKEFADEHLQESTLDKDKVLEIAQARQASLVISTCIDQANVTACYVAEKLGLPIPYSFETSLTVTNKVLMKKMMVESGVPTSRFVEVGSSAEFRNHHLKYPLIVKPADSNSSKGVAKAADETELHKVLDTALKISRCHKALVEQYIEGREIGIDCFVQDGEVAILMTKERRKIVGPLKSAQQIYGCIWPIELSSGAQENIKSISAKIAEAFSLRRTPLMIQAIINGDQVNVIEFAARFGGGESHRIIKLSTQFDAVDAAVNSFLGFNVVLNHASPQKYYAENFIYAYQGLFGELQWDEKLQKDGTIEYIDAYKTKGMAIGPDLTSNNRVGVFTVKSSDKNQLFEKIHRALNNVEVFDLEGRSIMRRDIY
jgi:formate-dependent phosphoribosylglycinamide formyltransferase (GAR transformylase)